MKPISHLAQQVKTQLGKNWAHRLQNVVLLGDDDQLKVVRRHLDEPDDVGVAQLLHGAAVHAQDAVTWKSKVIQRSLYCSNGMLSTTHTSNPTG